MKVQDKIARGQRYLDQGCAKANPGHDAIALLVHEQRTTNGRLLFLLGELTVIILLLFAHSVQVAL